MRWNMTGLAECQHISCCSAVDRASVEFLEEPIMPESLLCPPRTTSLRRQVVGRPSASCCSSRRRWKRFILPNHPLLRSADANSCTQIKDKCFFEAAFGHASSSERFPELWSLGIRYAFQEADKGTGPLHNIW